MICLIQNGVIVFGPAAWDFRAILEHLIVAGFDLLEGVLYQRVDTPEGEALQPVCPFPDAPPVGPLALPGITILPVVEVDEPAPEGKAMAGREPVVLGDRVELRPVWADLPPPPSLEEVKAAKRTAINAKRDAVEFGIITDSHGHRYDVHRDARQRITGAVAMAAAIPDEGFEWTDADENQQPHTGASMLALAGEILMWTNAVHRHAVALNKALDACATVTEIEALDIESGWPA